MKTDIYTVSGPEDVAPAAERACEVLRAGGLVAFPTETVYGLAACVASDEAMEKLRDLKDRPERPFTVHIGRAEQVSQYVAEIPAGAKRLMQKAWPGPLTIVMPTGGTLARAEWNEKLTDRLCYEGTIAFRLPDEPTAQAMLSRMEDPVVAPSANEAGRPPARSGREVLEALDGRIDLLIDAGPAKIGKSSTIIRFDESGQFEILREGLLSEKKLRSLMLRRMLFVCTGNTCRSPMAEGLARMELARRLDCRPAELPVRGWVVESAGTMGFGGAPATDEAVAAAGAMGADIAGHRSQPLTPELINSSDVIFCMTDGHLRHVCSIASEAVDRACLLNAGGGIPDPIGGSIQVYRRTAEHIHQAICAQLDSLDV